MKIRIHKSFVQTVCLGLTIFLWVVMNHSTAYAHVKWFSNLSFADRPLGLQDVITPMFVGLILLSVCVISLLVFLEQHLSQASWYSRVGRWLESFSGQSYLIIRVATMAVLLLSWQADTMLMPDLKAGSEWIGWYQYFLIFLLLFERTARFGGIGLIVPYGIGVLEFGTFYMLDYLFILGVAYFLAVSGASSLKIKESGLRVLSLTFGFSLCWVAFEKLIYPGSSLYLLQEHPQLALGLDIKFFLIGAAFVEFSIGYMLILGLLQRPLAMMVTVVFFLTTLIFGKVEVIGHTLFHAALIVFLVEGPGKLYTVPHAFPKRLGRRMAFASATFVILLAILLIPYIQGAWGQHQNHSRTQMHVPAAGAVFVAINPKLKHNAIGKVR